MKCFTFIGSNFLSRLFNCLSFSLRIGVKHCIEGLLRLQSLAGVHLAGFICGVSNKIYQIEW